MKNWLQSNLNCTTVCDMSDIHRRFDIKPEVGNSQNCRHNSTSCLVKRYVTWAIFVKNKISNVIFLKTCHAPLPFKLLVYFNELDQEHVPHSSISTLKVNYCSFNVRYFIDCSKIFKNSFYGFVLFFRNYGIVLDNSVCSRKRTVVPQKWSTARGVIFISNKNTF